MGRLVPFNELMVRSLRGGDAFARVATVGPVRDFSVHQAEILSQGSATAIASDSTGFAEYNNEHTAAVPTLIGGSAAVPQVFGASGHNITASGEAIATHNFGGGSTWARGDYNYVPDPLLNQNLHVHAHLFLGIYGGEVVSEGASFVNTVSAYAEVFGSWVRAQKFPNDDFWRITSNEAGVPAFSVGGVNLHLVFDFNVADASQVPSGQILTQTFGSLTADTDPGEFASGTWNQSSAAWVYVTAEGTDLTPGDFNADGVVNGEDYKLWADGRPQADGNLDGFVNDLDFNIWSAHNTDAIVVTTEADENNGTGDVSLREAIGLAANHVGPDTIVFAPSVHNILLTGGVLAINTTNEVSIIGSGSDRLTINGNTGVIFAISGTSGSPVIHSSISRMMLTGASSNSAVSHNDQTGTHDLVLDELKIVGNRTGVGISRNGHVTVSNSEIAESTIIGIGHTAGTTGNGSTTISNCIIRDSGRQGVYVDTLSGSLAVFDSEIISSNKQGLGFAAVETGSIPLTISGSTIAENNGRGLLTSGVGNVFNTTISSNKGTGATVIGSSSNIVFTNGTITQNRPTNPAVIAGLLATSNGHVTLHNTIVAQNFAGPLGSEINADLGASSAPSGFSTTSSFNLIGTVGNSGLSATNYNIILGANGDAGLASLGYYGGPTRTHALLATSLAIEAGDNSKVTALGLDTDQRGQLYDRIVDWDHDSDPRVDIGAFEVALGELYS